MAPRRRLAWLLLVTPLVLSASACEIDGTAVQSTPQKQATTSPTSSGTAAGGGVSTEGESPTQSNPTPTPAPTATPTPTQTATPTAAPYVPYSVKMTLTPSTASINIAAADGESTAGYPSTAQLSAEVLMSDASTTSAVLWTSSATTSASVNSSGLVTAGTVAGEALIWAIAQDGRASASCAVTVTSDAALDLTIQ